MFCSSLNEKCNQTSRRNLLCLTASIMAGIAFCMLASCGETQRQQTDTAGHSGLVNEAKQLSYYFYADLQKKGKT